jgi:Zn-dependent protease with chaperone function
MNSQIIVWVVAFILLPGAIQGQQPARNATKEKAMLEELAAVAPSSVDTFRRGTEAMDQGEYEKASQLYAEVAKQAPAFTPVLRRLGTCLAASGHSDEGLELLEKAVQIDRSPENLASLAQVLASLGEGRDGTEEQRTWAFALAKEAKDKYKASDDPSYALLLAHLAMVQQKEGDFREATSILVKNYSDLMATHYYNAVRLAMDENWIAAEDEIKKAEEMGLSTRAVQDFLDSGVHRRATAWRWSRYALYIVAAWVCGLLMLFATGKIFSKLTLYFIERSDPNSQASIEEIRLRRCYRGLINTAGSFYYVSIPVVMFLVVAVAGSVIYGFFVLGTIPIKLVIVLVVGAIVTLYMMLTSLFIKPESGDPGRALTLEEAPGLWKLTREVADDLGTRALDEIRIIPGTEIFVYERGTAYERRHDLAQRILVIGIGLFSGFSQNSFRAVLAHEYGHLANRDTAGGDVALRVSQDMMKLAYAMAQGGQAVWWNVAFQFLRIYAFLFRRVSYGATRLQEVLADRTAARLYGAAAFEQGLRHVIRRQIQFNYLAEKSIGEATKSGRALQNIYVLDVKHEKAVEAEIENALTHQTSEEDTHPSPSDRFRLVSRVICPTQQAPSGPMWDLFAQREKIIQEMTARIEDMVKAAAA